MKITGKIKWCCRQKRGIDLLEQNKNLADGFILKAERWLEEMKNAKYKESKIAFAYYVMYDSIYSLLQRIGIKSGIHECTFECIKVFLSEYFNNEEVKFIKGSHDARNDTTYYINKDVPDELINEVRSELDNIKNPKTKESKE